MSFLIISFNLINQSKTQSAPVFIEQSAGLFDDDRSSTINIHNLRRVAKELGETMSAYELKEMLQRAASNENEITFDDFYSIMTKKTFA